MGALLAIMMIVVLILVRPVHVPLHIPLLGIDWLGSLLWGIFMLSFTYICVYGNFYDWWDAPEICIASALGFTALSVNLWRATFLHHPYMQQTQLQAIVVNMKQIYGYLLTGGLICLAIILLSYSPLRPNAIFPKWSTIRRAIHHTVRPLLRKG